MALAVLLVALVCLIVGLALTSSAWLIASLVASGVAGLVLWRDRAQRARAALASSAQRLAAAGMGTPGSGPPGSGPPGSGPSGSGPPDDECDPTRA